MVRMDGEKMAKSLGNLVFVSELRKDFDPMAIRLGLLNFHYRDSWEWNEGIMGDATDRLQAWQRAGEGLGALEAVRHFLDNDLNTPEAIAAIDDAARKGEGVSIAAQLLGINSSGA